MTGLTEAFIQESLDSWDLNKPLIPVYLVGPVKTRRKNGVLYAIFFGIDLVVS